MGSLVAKLLLPTLSSLVFLPTISIAAKRRFHMEAMVYFFTMFFVAVRSSQFPLPLHVSSSRMPPCATEEQPARPLKYPFSVISHRVWC